MGPLPTSPRARACSPGQVPAERSRPELLPRAGSGRRTMNGPQQGWWPPPGHPRAETQAGLGQGPTSAFGKVDTPTSLCHRGSRCPPRTDAPDGHLPRARDIQNTPPEFPTLPSAPLPLYLSNLCRNAQPAPTPPSAPTHLLRSVPQPVLPDEGLPAPAPDATVPTTVNDQGCRSASLEDLDGGRV